MRNKGLYIMMLVTTWLGFMSVSYADDGMTAELLKIQREWAIAKYEVPAGQRETALKKLANEASALAGKYPDRAEPVVWQAIVLSTEAGETGGLSALHLVKQARTLLLKAKGIDPDVLQGSIYTSLGSLYYQVPGWPVGFGDDDKAEAFLKQALSINPHGIDPNYFYADFLFEQGRYDEAMKYAKRALDAPARPDRPLADKGRHEEASRLMQKISQKLALLSADKVEPV